MPALRVVRSLPPRRSRLPRLWHTRSPEPRRGTGRALSRYVRLTCPRVGLEDVHAHLDACGLAHDLAGPRRLMLEGSLECAGDPVDLRVPAGTLGTVEDFGFVVTDGEIELVCGELDRDVLLRSLLDPLRQALATRALATAASEAGLEIERAEADARGTLRVVLREK
jgi:hypothetical protein